ncbi:MAG TPA: SDR family oxidoreductase [Armatimonadota bacterium]|jgi:NAD(P)-dependent dehydrogenase (short-subunit alcohol dehydrogenase family)
MDKHRILKPLIGRVAVVTGAGRGIGRATTLALVNAGATVVAMARTATDLSSLVGEALDGYCVMHPGDVTHERDVITAFKTATVLGQPSILVNAAGAAQFGPTKDFALSDWKDVVHANLTGTFLCCREAIRVFDEGGHIVNIGSIAGHTAFPNSAAYCAAKWGVVGLTKSLAAEARASGREDLRFTLLSPGSVDTALWDNVEYAPPREDMLQPADVARAIVGIVAQPRRMSVDEIRLMPAKGVLDFTEE